MRVAPRERFVVVGADALDEVFTHVVLVLDDVGQVVPGIGLTRARTRTRRPVSLDEVYGGAAVRVRPPACPRTTEGLPAGPRG